MDILKLSTVFFNLLKESGHHTTELKKLLFKDIDLFCSICGKKFSSEDEITIEHINPKAKGGRNDLGNFAFSCELCNRNRQTSDLEGYRQYVKNKKTDEPPVGSLEFRKFKRKLLGQANYLLKSLNFPLETNVDDIISIVEDFTITDQKKSEILKTKYGLKERIINWLLEQRYDLRKIVQIAKELKRS